MPPLSICINTQTPLIQFLDSTGGTRRDERGGGPLDLASLREGVDYRYSPGGVTRMVYPLVRRLLKERVLESAHWVALNPRAPATVRLGGLTLHNVAIESERLPGYGLVKEAIWGRIHELDTGEERDDLFWTEAFSEYAYYNRMTAELIQRLDGEFDFDVFYVHDFQQLAVGHMLGTLKPKVFRWHIPFDATTIPEKWRSLLATYLNSYDVVVMSARRYTKSLRALRPTGTIVRMYPYVDPDDYSVPSGDHVAETAQRLRLAPEDVVVLVVARMDPIKGQDLAIDAVGRLSEKYPTLKLVLVGNGSFSGSAAGLGLSKSAVWRARLEEIVKERGWAGRVVFAGHLGQADLDGLYERCSFTLLPSVLEGFGLVVVESWLHGKPAIVTSRAGIAELIRDGSNGLLFDPDAPKTLVRAIKRLLDDRTGKLRARLVQNGRRTARKCSLDAAEQAESKMLTEVTEG